MQYLRLSSTISSQPDLTSAFAPSISIKLYRDFVMTVSYPLVSRASTPFGSPGSVTILPPTYSSNRDKNMEDEITFDWEGEIPAGDTNSEESFASFVTAVTTITVCTSYC
jgi:hypothetical protein